MDTLSRTFSALADPTRRAILARLAQGVATVKELSEPFSISAPAISKHLRVLEGAGLISQGRDAQWRPCRLEPEPLRAVAEWTDAYRTFWEESFERLDAYLEELQARPPTTTPVERSARGPSGDGPRSRGARSRKTKAPSDHPRAADSLGCSHGTSPAPPSRSAVAPSSATRSATRQRKPTRGPRR